MSALLIVPSLMLPLVMSFWAVAVPAPTISAVTTQARMVFLTSPPPWLATRPRAGASAPGRSTSLVDLTHRCQPCMDGWQESAEAPASAGLLVVVGVDLDVVLPLVGQLVLGEERRRGRPRRRRRSRCTRRGRCRAGRPGRSRARRGSGGCSRPGRPRRRRCPRCRCRARRSRRPWVSLFNRCGRLMAITSKMLGARGHPTGGEAGDRPSPGAARAVPDREVPGAHGGSEPGLRPGELGSPRGRRGGPRFMLCWDEFMALPQTEVTVGHPLRDALVEARHRLARRCRVRDLLEPGGVRPAGTHLMAHSRRGLHHQRRARRRHARTRCSWPTPTRVSRWSRTTARRCGCSCRSATLEVGEVPAPARGDERRSDGLLGAQRLPQRRRSLAWRSDTGSDDLRRGSRPAQPQHGRLRPGARHGSARSRPTPTLKVLGTRPSPPMTPRRCSGATGRSGSRSPPPTRSQRPGAAPRTGGRWPGCAARRSPRTSLWSRSPAFTRPGARASVDRRPGVRQPRDGLGFAALRPPMILLTGGTGSDRQRAATAPRGRPHAGALPGPGPQAPGGPNACACRSRSETSPTPPRFATRCEVWTPWCTSPRRSATSHRASIEELNALATLRLVRATERSGATRFLFASAIGASLQSPTRFFRSKALAPQGRRVGRSRPPPSSLRRSSTRRAIPG